jgi:hypothetical protein
MDSEILVLAYGDKKANGRGLYRITVNTNRVNVKSVYLCNEKPGAVTALGNSWQLSFRDEQLQSETDNITLYSLRKDCLAVAEQLDTPLGAGPRIMRLAANRRFAYL